jgi:hypothetical protein
VRRTLGKVLMRGDPDELNGFFAALTDIVVRYEAIAANELLRFIAVRDIRTDEELTVNYNGLGGVAEWPTEHWFDRMSTKPIFTWRSASRKDCPRNSPAAMGISVWLIIDFGMFLSH